ncbi:hypothetical protein [Mumia flava]|nr:hypothetical protein [Mumia flava]
MALIAVVSSALMADPIVGGDDALDEVYASGDETVNEDSSPGGIDAPTAPGATGPQPKYRYELTCTESSAQCATTYLCPEEGQVRYDIYVQYPGEPWQYSGSECRGGDDPPPAEAELPEVTPGDVLREVRRLPLPRADINVQPSGTTLVNLDTVFSTKAPSFERTVTIFSQQVAVTATPTAYTWHFGDGTTRTTDHPGRPYPALDITHAYARADRTFRPRVAVTFTISYSVDGGPTLTLDQTITTDGPAVALETREAVPVLVDDPAGAGG